MSLKKNPYVVGIEIDTTTGNGKMHQSWKT